MSYIRLAEKPGLEHPGYPLCGACAVEVDYDGDSWVCPSCGTSWDAENLEADPEDATMYDEWSGEELDGPIIPNEKAWRIGNLRGTERDAMVTRLGLGDTK